MLVSLFDYDLPPDRIALEPLRPREAAKMLVVAPTGRCKTDTSPTCQNSCRPGDAVVVNDTRVIAARLNGIRVRGEAVAMSKSR